MATPEQKLGSGNPQHTDGQGAAAMASSGPHGLRVLYPLILEAGSAVSLGQWQ